MGRQLIGLFVSFFHFSWQRRTVRVAVPAANFFARQKEAMLEIRYMTWEESEAEHAADWREMLEAVASGRKSARQVQEENSLIPLDAKIVINWKDHAERVERDISQRAA